MTSSVLTDRQAKIADLRARLAAADMIDDTREAAKARAEIEAAIHKIESDAAHDLLAMLKHIVRWHDQLQPEDIARAEAVIANAEART